VTSAVRWQACVEGMIRDGCDQFVEVGPNRVLAGMMRKIDRKMKCVSVNSQEALDKLTTSPAGVN
jgi:[acyl-carrier-protein] S-malonyltransferase